MITEALVSILVNFFSSGSKQIFLLIIYFLFIFSYLSSIVLSINDFRNNLSLLSKDAPVFQIVTLKPIILPVTHKRNACYEFFYAKIVILQHNNDAYKLNETEPESNAMILLM
ncbi:hypothetical protein ACQK5W_02390 [Pantoea sp. FN060301]|uniref:hypothetical protein n=1 Tax=Pantoea sp. FN060301 TaxID=3420380 RepID=UPI003D16DF68